MTAWQLVTGEYPPAVGGVADYTRAVATALANRGAAVHVWCPGGDGSALESGVEVHRVAGAWRPSAMQEIAPRVLGIGGRLVVQWVPHAFGRRSLNLAFCRWISRLSRTGLHVDVMVHEPFLAFLEGSWRQDAAAAVHRVMAATLLRAARRIWVSIPAWEARVRPWLFGRRVPITWLPVPSNVDVATDLARIRALRHRVGAHDTQVVGHFGTHGAATAEPLSDSLTAVLERDSVAVVLIGRDSERFARHLSSRAPSAAARIHATGTLDACGISCHLQACDVLLQPYIDGASTRRGTLMAALAHGAAVVTTVGRLSEPLWRDEHEHAVVAVDAGQPRQLAHAVHRLLDDPDRRRGLGMQARALYQRRFDLRHTVDALLASAAGG